MTDSIKDSDAGRLISLLKLTPHPEGGFYRQTYRDLSGGDAILKGRGYSTLIYFLLRSADVSRWHRIDAAEVWHFYRGAPVELKIGRHRHLLGPGIENGEQPQIVVPPGEWQTARSLGAYSLVGCTVAPGFDFATFELAPDSFKP